MTKTQPREVRDEDWSKWVLQCDGTYRLLSYPGKWSDRYVGYSLDQIEREFGIISKTYDDDHGERDYRYLRTR